MDFTRLLQEAMEDYFKEKVEMKENFKEFQQEMIQFEKYFLEMEP